MSGLADVVISPATYTDWSFTIDSQATRPRRIDGENGVKNGIGNLVADFVGMSFGYRLRGEQIMAVRLAHQPPCSQLKMDDKVKRST